MEPLSAAEAQALICYLKRLSEELDNVIQLLQKRKAGKQNFLDLAATAQMNIEVMYQELMNDREECSNEAIACKAVELFAPPWASATQPSNGHTSKVSLPANSQTLVSHRKHAAG